MTENNRDYDYYWDDMPVSDIRPEFRINSIEAANWYLRKLATIEAEQKRVVAQAAGILKDLVSEYESLQARHQADLEHFVREELERQGNKRRNLKLLQGTVSIRTVPANIRVANIGTATAWVFANDDFKDQFLKYREPELDVAAYRDYAKETGEMLPGIEVTPQHETVKITFGKEE